MNKYIESVVNKVEGKRFTDVLDELVMLYGKMSDDEKKEFLKKLLEEN